VFNRRSKYLAYLVAAFASLVIFYFGSYFFLMARNVTAFDGEGQPVYSSVFRFASRVRLDSSSSITLTGYRESWANRFYYPLDVLFCETTDGSVPLPKRTP
jgi:hypothetical protein